MTDRLEHAADLSVPAFMNRQLNDARLLSFVQESIFALAGAVLPSSS